MLLCFRIIRKTAEGECSRGHSFGDRQEQIAQAVEEATAAVNANPVDEDEDDRRTVAEPEMEFEEDVSMVEPRPEMEDMDKDAEEVSSRQPVLINDGEFYMDQRLLHAKLCMQVPIYAHMESAWVVDPTLDLARYMAFVVINYMHKNWKGNVKWLDLPLEAMHGLFLQKKRYEVLGSWGEDLSRMDEQTGTSRDVTDDEVLAYGQSLRDHEDPSGIHYPKSSRRTS